MKEKLITRFSKYLSFPTRANGESETYPSTNDQLVFGDFLVVELISLGLTDVEKDKYGYVTATLQANTDKKLPVIAFIAHFDTAPDMLGISAPRIIENYDGNDIVLDYETDTKLTICDFPELKNYVGQTLLTTDGKTLLGADDKAGIAEIMCALEYLIQNPEIKHGKIRVAFTPDEEIGKGVIHFVVEKFGADFGYTVDGGMLGELEYENFNAAGAVVSIQGRNVHPGYAKNKMINALLIAMEFHSLLPEFQRPEYTQDYEGFYLLTKMEGSVENAILNYIIRDHDKILFEQKKEFLLKTTEFLRQKHKNCKITCEITDQYRNMREKVEPVFYIVERAKQAMLDAGVVPIIKPIRGGTDGANLSYKGLPCPNIFTGGHNFHGKYEFIPVESMMKAVEVIVNIANK